jgi:outer membrane protein insertion porin family
MQQPPTASGAARAASLWSGPLVCPLVGRICLLPLLRAARLTAVCVLAASVPVLPAMARPRVPTAGAATPVAGGRIAAIRVEGNQRIEPGTVLSYMAVQVGDPFAPDALDRSLKTLYATGLFSDVHLDRVGDTLVVRVKENPVVNEIAFEGNHKENEDSLSGAISLRPRAVFTPGRAEADRDKLLALYAQKGRFAAQVTPQIIRLPDNRVNVVYKIKEGKASVVARIVFVGNHAFSESRLRSVISTRETVWWKFLSSSDNYDPDHIDYDRELLRRFYLRNGYVDFIAGDPHAELSPDRGGFFVTFTIHEGARYRVGKISVYSKLPHLKGATLMRDIELRPGDWYDGDAIERAVTKISDDVRNRGYAFVDVAPRIVRKPKLHTVDLVFDVGEGERTYVERIDIVGNVRTEDRVIRREFRLAEGDAYNAELVRRTKQRLQDLGYFGKVSINTGPGSAPDRAILTTEIEEKSTGQLTLGGGYSTDVGALLNAGLSEKNFIGTGIDAGINGTLGTYENQLDLTATDPYFLGRNLVAGFDIFHIDNSNQTYTTYDERRTGLTLNLGYAFNDYLRQTWNYTIVDRNVYNVEAGSSIYITQQEGPSLLSQVGQTFTIDYRDSRLAPHKGFVIRLGTDFAGLGGDVHFVRAKIDGSYYVPLDRITHSTDWDIEFSAGAGNLFNIGSSQERIIDRFFLGGDNLRGFEAGGAGPRDITASTEDSLGGRFIWTQSTELHYPLPVSPDFGLTGRAFVDVGALSGVDRINNDTITDSTSPRVGAGIGVSWNSPFGLINVDVADPVVKQNHDKTQVFRFGFGTRF